MVTNNLNSLSTLKNNMDMNMEIYFTLYDKRYMLLPDPDTDILEDGWLLVYDDRLLKKGTSRDVLNYKVNGQPISKLWSQAENIEM